MEFMGQEMIAAREGIRYTVGIYNQSVDRPAYDNLAAVFTEDGEMIISGVTSFKGRQTIIDSLSAGAKKRGVGQPGNFQRHTLGNSMINVIDSKTARAVHFAQVMTELGFDHAGLYIDDFVKVGDRWLIQTRRANMEWARPESRFNAFPSHKHISTSEELDIGFLNSERLRGFL
ncbi:MAG: nuclear transport factor 2 family protein [Hyphomicrobiales bacterium]|nr:MAG: nuclear transport factor 2 family protein [Hyphomicrobiales bacterium]